MEFFLTYYNFFYHKKIALISLCKMEDCRKIETSVFWKHVHENSENINGYTSHKALSLSYRWIAGLKFSSFMNKVSMNWIWNVGKIILILKNTNLNSKVDFWPTNTTWYNFISLYRMSFVFWRVAFFLVNLFKIMIEQSQLYRDICWMQWFSSEYLRDRFSASSEWMAQF